VKTIPVKPSWNSETGKSDGDGGKVGVRSSVVDLLKLKILYGV